MTDQLKARLLQALSKADQLHLLQFWDELTPLEQQQLAGQIDRVDLSLIQRLCSGQAVDENWGALAERASSPPAIRLHADNSISAREAREAGEAALRAGRVAVLLVAGGQGSRLGFPHPKGMFPLGPVSGRTLFQIHADRLRATSAHYGVSLPWYVMTSPATHDETVAYFEEQHGCGVQDLSIFCQGTMPAVAADSGKLLLSERGQLFESPDGHGGTLAALAQAGYLGEMRSRGVERLFYFQVDNPLVEIAAPEAIGYHILSASEMTTQVVAKRDAQEKVGNVVSVDGKLRIIEYSDLPDEAAERRNADGSLAIWAGSIAVHVFDVAFLDRVKNSADALPFHQALKKVPYIDEDGARIDPSRPNAIKFERFIFDLLPAANNAIVVEVAEDEAFAPLKNASGAAKDTAETARAAMVAQQRRWLEAAGVQVREGAQVEVNPRFAWDAASLADRVSPGLQIKDNHYFAPTDDNA